MDMTFARDGVDFSYNQATEPGSLALLSSVCVLLKEDYNKIQVYPRISSTASNNTS